MPSEIRKFYHWRDPSMEGSQPITREMLTNERAFYVCSNMWDWASPETKGMELYEIDAIVRNPLVLENQFAVYEFMFSDGNSTIEKFLEKGEFDAVVYTAHALGQGVDQIALLRAKDQVVLAARVPDENINWGMIKLMSMFQNKGWSDILTGGLNKGKLERIKLIDQMDPSWHDWQRDLAIGMGHHLLPGEIVAMGEVFNHQATLEEISGAVLRMQHLNAQGTKPYGNPYFYKKKVFLDGLTIYPKEKLEHAVMGLGGQTVKDWKEADLIIFGRDSLLHKSEDPWKAYAGKMLCVESKIDDLLQELPQGIESLF